MGQYLFHQICTNIFIAVYKTALSAEKGNQINLRLSFMLRLTGSKCVMQMQMRLVKSEVIKSI